MTEPSPPERHGDVTVVVAAWNASSTLADAVGSALASPDVVQCVVVDDASDDDTTEVARGLAERDDRVELIVRAERGGPCSARNDGLRAARGAAVCFLDADDELLAGAPGVLAESLASTRGAVAAIGRFRATDRDGTPVDVGAWSDVQLAPVVRRHGQLVASSRLDAESLVTRLISPPPGAWVVDVTSARALGGFDARVRRSEDLEFLVRLAAAGTVATSPLEVLRYTRHATQRSAASSRRRWGRGHALWCMLRAAPDARSTRALARGMQAYHLELFEQRRALPTLHGKALGARNLAAASVLRMLGSFAALLPRRRLPPLKYAPVSAVD